ncbi:MAG: hypothetical protein ABMA64_04960 [Myxococcota bacterium]
MKVPLVEEVAAARAELARAQAGGSPDAVARAAEVLHHLAHRQDHALTAPEYAEVRSALAPLRARREEARRQLGLATRRVAVGGPLTDTLARGLATLPELPEARRSVVATLSEVAVTAGAAVEWEVEPASDVEGIGRQIAFLRDAVSRAAEAAGHADAALTLAERAIAEILG